jgi:4-aminobutyrate aminotransferase
VVAAIKDAADRFLHISSDYWHEGQVRLGERLAALAPMNEPAMSFFCQSGTESVEGALKLARYVTGRPRFIGFLGGFHGRTMGSLAFTSSKYTQQKGFFPTMPGVTLVPYPNPYRPLFAGEDQGRAVLDYVENVLFAGAVPPSEVAAVLVEPIQGEGGINVPEDGYLPGLRKVCDRQGWLLMLDEVQSGIGRTGRWFAHQWLNVKPDVMTLAKGLANGVPIGACLAHGAASQVFRPGNHGATFGGNPLATTAAYTTLRIIADEGLMENAVRIGDLIRAGLRERLSRLPGVKEIRGKGLMIAIELDRPCSAIVQQALDRGLLINVTVDTVVRLLPPLIMQAAEAQQLVEGVADLVREFLAEPVGVAAHG